MSGKQEGTVHLKCYILYQHSLDIMISYFAQIVISVWLWTGVLLAQGSHVEVLQYNTFETSRGTLNEIWMQSTKLQE